MDKGSQLSDVQIMQAFQVCRAELHHEYDVLSNRLNSYITSQAFLVSAYAISMGNMNLAWGDLFNLTFPLLLSFVAILLSIRAQPGIGAACNIIARWHNREADLFQLARGLDDYAPIAEEELRVIHDRNLLFAQTSPWIFGPAWLLMAILTIYLHTIKH
jgi:hypothetical protein